MIFAEAPSNIALIKYMGKSPNGQDQNRPTNASLSYTLPHLRSRVEIYETQSGADLWRPLDNKDWMALQLPEKGQKKFLDFFRYLKELWSVPGHYEVRSANNFPAGAGVASSASSFAALTLATSRLAAKDLSAAQLAEISRRGSGSSGRSLFSDYCIWDEDGFRNVGQTWPKLSHDLIVIDETHKDVSSSQAHFRVLESSMFAGRVDRAKARLRQLIESFDQQNWRVAAEIAWDEFWDMHTLFHTCKPPFFYMNEKTLHALKAIRDYSVKAGDLPLVTMDAGPNIHLLYLPHQDLLRKNLRERLSDFRFLSGE